MEKVKERRHRWRECVFRGFLFLLASGMADLLAGRHV